MGCSHCASPSPISIQLETVGIDRSHWIDWGKMGIHEIILFIIVGSGGDWVADLIGTDSSLGRDLAIDLGCVGVANGAGLMGVCLMMVRRCFVDDDKGNYSTSCGFLLLRILPNTLLGAFHSEMSRLLAVVAEISALEANPFVVPMAI
ncbi:hypothetical protein F0562_019615 [Nyssa sinensis]|uniref:Uncharacterized protein n=1 Tax=Nyssa sinensis TaxID=561372 RepID=A0A5J5BU80_9ASTE|nr:hypothetical protein F0562_019615 [Nyssa sinensis]